jgi:PAS domain S-box-containing protein
MGARETVAKTNRDIIRYLLDSLGDGVIFFDPDNKVRWTNETFERMRGRSEYGSLLGRSIFDCHPSKDHGRVSQILKDLRTGRETIRYHRARRSGIIEAEREAHYDIFYAAVRSGQGDYLGAAMIIRDVGEIRNLQDQIHRSEERYRDLVESIDSGIFSLDQKGRITYANNGLLNMLGYQLNEMNNRIWTELLKPELTNEARRIFNAVLSRQEGSIFETQMVHHDGRTIYALMNLSVLEGDTENPSLVRGIVADITARKELERETLERERFQGVIEMAGATCHHLNQPLANILARTQMLLREMDKKDPRYRSMEILEKEARRMGAITRKMQNITSYETESYMEGGSRIIDLERATGKK